MVKYETILNGNGVYVQDDGIAMPAAPPRASVPPSARLLSAKARETEPPAPGLAVEPGRYLLKMAAGLIIGTGVMTAGMAARMSIGHDGTKLGFVGNAELIMTGSLPQPAPALNNNPCVETWRASKADPKKWAVVSKKGPCR